MLNNKGSTVYMLFMKCKGWLLRGRQQQAANTTHDLNSHKIPDAAIEALNKHIEFFFGKQGPVYRIKSIGKMGYNHAIS